MNTPAMSTAVDVEPEAHETGGEPDQSRCIRCARSVGPESFLLGSRLRRPGDPVCSECIGRFAGQLASPRPPQLGRALSAGVVAAAVAIVLWYVAHGVGDLLAAIVAVAAGAGIGSVLVLASGGRHGWPLSVSAVVLTVLAMVLSANFVQRDQLQNGIDTLEPRWESMRTMAEESVAVSAAAAEPADTTDPAETAGEPDTSGASSGGLIPEDAALAEDTEISGIIVPAGSVIPPPEIVAVLPAPAFEMMSDEVMAVVWPNVPETVRDQLPPERVDAVQEMIATAEAIEREARESGATLEGLTLAEARAIYEESSYDIPRPVLRCAPPPDLTQPTAAAGLGFPDGVPLLLPLSDYYQQRERGDGLDVGAPSPWCFARENAADTPLEAASWLVGLGLAALIPARRRLVAVVDGVRSRSRFERAT